VGDTTQLTLASFLGTEPFNYIWRRDSTVIERSILPKLGRDISLSLPALKLSDSGNYTLEISNAAGLIVSAAVVVSVSSIPSLEIFGPTDVVSHSPVKFQAITNSPQTKGIYEWRKNGALVAGESSVTFEIADSLVEDSGIYTVSLVVGSRKIESSPHHLMVASGPLKSPGPSLTPSISPTTPPPVDNPPSKPRVLLPTTNQINVALRPLIQWTMVKPVSSGSIGYDVVISTESNCNSPIFSGTDLSSVTYNLEAGFSLISDRDYFICVNARDRKTGAQSGFTNPSKFRTRGNVLAPTLYTRPATTAASPSGQREIIVGGVGGEQNGIARLYERTSSGDLELGSTKINANPDGRFEISVNVLKFSSQNGKRDYVAAIDRCTNRLCSPRVPGSILQSPKSSPVSYYYQDELALETPVLVKSRSTDLAFEWNAIPTATQYKIYRRLGMEDCASESEADCYNTSAFSLIATKSAGQLCAKNANATLCSYQDMSAMISSADKSTYGVSYFVIANRGMTDSSRSRAVRFVASDGLNSIAPPRTPSGVNRVFVRSPSGRSVRVYYCGVDTTGYLNSDNFPDLGLQVQYLTEAQLGGKACGSYAFDTRAQSRVYAFDALSLTQDAAAGDSPCVFGADISNLDPSTLYCIQVCQQDENGLSECSNETVTTQADSLPPFFEGITSLVSLSSGTGLQASWDFATDPDTQSTSQSVIQYEVRVTKDINSSGQGIFDDQVVAKIVRSTDTSSILEGLQTNTYYCVQVTALDDQGNRAVPLRPQLCATTLDNRPQVQIKRIRSRNSDEAYNLEIEFQITDRQAGSPEHRVIFDQLEFKIEGGDWIPVESKHLSGFDPSQLMATNSPRSSAVNRITWNTLPYFSGERKLALRIRVKDQTGSADLASNSVIDVNGVASDWGTSNEETLFEGMTHIGSYGKDSLSGCSLSAKALSPSPFVWLLLACALGLGFLMRASKRHSEGQK
jgi:hypothetical protein